MNKPLPVSLTNLLNNKNFSVKVSVETFLKGQIAPVSQRRAYYKDLEVLFDQIHASQGYTTACLALECNRPSHTTR